jgi:hypothetical protein
LRGVAICREGPISKHCLPAAGLLDEVKDKLSSRCLASGHQSTLTEELRAIATYVSCGRIAGVHRSAVLAATYEMITWRSGSALSAVIGVARN